MVISHWVGAAATVLVVLFVSDAVQAQSSLGSVLLSVEKGRSLRVVTRDSVSTEGAYAGSVGDSLLIEPHGAPAVAFEFASVAEVWEWRTSRRRGVKLGAFTGGAAGALVLGTSVALSGDGTDPSYAAAFGIGAFVGFLGGMALGALVGGTGFPERIWVLRYPEDATVRPPHQWSLSWSSSAVALSTHW